MDRDDNSVPKVVAMRATLEPDRGEIIEAEGGMGDALGYLTRATVDAIKQRLMLFKELKTELLRCTNDGDWVDLDGDPYLSDSGIHNVARAAGIEFGEPKLSEEKGEDAQGPYVNYTVELSGSWRPARIRHADIGTSSTRDPFFAKNKEGLVPFDKIPLGNVKKKAFTNAQHRVLMKLLGLGGVSWEQLRALGINPPSGSVRFRGGERQAATGAGQWTAQKKRLWGILLELAGGAEAEASEALYNMTHSAEKNILGKRNPQDLSDKQAAWLLPRVEAEYTKTMGQAYSGSAGAPPPGKAPAPEPGTAG